jgi:hypothetical protein
MTHLAVQRHKCQTKGEDNNAEKNYDATGSAFFLILYQS